MNLEKNKIATENVIIIIILIFLEITNAPQIMNAKINIIK